MKGIVKEKLAKLKLNHKNPNKVEQEDFEKLVQSIKDFPEMLDSRPVVADEDGTILGGNHRYLAAKEAGLEEVPVFYATDWTEEQKQRFIIQDNVRSGDWDLELLKEWNADDLAAWGAEVEWPNLEEETESEPRGLGTPVIRYELIFNSEQEQDLFIKFLNQLKETYPDCETITERLTLYLQEKVFHG